MTSVHGNKAAAVTAGLCLTSALFLFSGMLSEKRAKIRFYEKKYSRTLSALEVNNQKIKAEQTELFEK